MGYSSFKILENAADLSLLTIEQMRAAANVPNEMQDDALIAMEQRVADAIMAECDIAVADEGEYPPTLRRERIEETFDLSCTVRHLILSRRHNITINSLLLDSAAVTSANYLLKSESGFIIRRPSMPDYGWSGTAAVVDYWAGFATVPGALQQAAINAISAFWDEVSRSTGLKRIEIPGVMLKEYWITEKSDFLLPDDVKEALKRFRNGQV